MALLAVEVSIQLSQHPISCRAHNIGPIGRRQKIKEDVIFTVPSENPGFGGAMGQVTSGFELFRAKGDHVSDFLTSTIVKPEPADNPRDI